jgi:RHS repeat-associated protein
MRTGKMILGCAIALLTAGPLAAQSPLLGSIEAPFPNLQSQIRMAGQTWASGTVAYGPAGTPLVLSGSDFGSSGTVLFTPYQNGIAGTTVSAPVTLWTPSLLILKVPSGAYPGLVTITSGGKTSNGLPFIVMSGIYSGTCPALPPDVQLQIVTSSLEDGMAGQSYSYPLSANGGTEAYTWSITNGSLPSGLNLNASTGVISGTPTTAYGPALITVQVTDSSSPQKTDTATLSLTISSSGVPSVIYSYCIFSSPSASCSSPSGGYDPAGNVVSYYDSVTGTWSMSGDYNSLNQLTGAQATAGSAYSGLQASWSYDIYGNRTGENFSGNDQGNAPVPGSTSFNYNSNNQVQSVGSGVLPTYDAAGDILTDTQGQQYAYDAEGRVCAVNGAGGLVGYLYDAEGTRVAKGTIALVNINGTLTLSCDTTQNHFQLTTSYILGLGNEQLTELSWSGGTPPWAHTNVWAAGQLVATYSPNHDPSQIVAGVLNFHLDDWLGSRRVLTDAMGNVAESCASLPYGNGETCAPTPTEHLFTGKERDSESGNDYFGARYYASSMGRFMSPDWSAKQEPVPYARLDNPQTLNLYAYLRNNPLAGVDADGHCGSDTPNCQKLATNPVSNVSPATKQAINNSVKASNSPSAAAGDQKGGSHEEGGVSYTVNGKQVIAPAQPGAYHDVTVPGVAQIDPYKAADPALQKPGEVQADTEWHVHPSATADTTSTNDAGQTVTTPHVFNQPPSGVDIQNASPAPTVNIVVGARDKTVYVYTNQGCTCKESLKDFNKPQ